MEAYQGVRSVSIGKSGTHMSLRKPKQNRPSQSLINIEMDDDIQFSFISDFQDDRDEMARFGDEEQNEKNEENSKESEESPFLAKDPFEIADLENSQHLSREQPENEHEQVSAQNISVNLKEETQAKQSEQQPSEYQRSETVQHTQSNIADQQHGMLQVPSGFRSRMNSKNFLASHFFIKVEKRKQDKFTSSTMCPSCEELFYSLEKMPYELLCGDESHGTIRCQECWEKKIEHSGDKGYYVECKLAHALISSGVNNTSELQTIGGNFQSFKTDPGHSERGPKILTLIGSKLEKNFFDINFDKFKARYDILEMCRKEISYNFQEDEEETPAPQIFVQPEISEFEKNCTILPCEHKIQRMQLRAFFNNPIPHFVQGQMKSQIQVICPIQRCQQIFHYPKYEGDSEEKFGTKNFPNPRKLASQTYIQFETTHYLLQEEVLNLQPQNFQKAEQGLSMIDCVVCTSCFHQLNQMHQIFGISQLHVCYECLYLRCVQTYPPMDYGEFERSQKITFPGRVERATFTVPGYQNYIKLQFLVVPSYRNEPFSHLHFVKFIAKLYRQKYAVVEDLEMNKQFQMMYPFELKSSFLANVHKYLTCAVCEHQNINQLQVGYKLKTSFRSYVCGNCVEEKKRDIEKAINRNPDQHSGSREIIMKFQSSRDGILSYFRGRIHFNFPEPPYIYYDMEEAKEILGHLELPRENVSQIDEPDIECFQCLQHFDQLARSPKVICRNNHCICFECLCALVFGFYQSKNIPNIICGVCNEEGPDVTFERVGSEKLNLQKLFETNEELVEKVKKWKEFKKQ